MRWAEGFIAVDWGTTNRRAYRLDSSGKCVDEFEDHEGVLWLATDGGGVTRYDGKSFLNYRLSDGLPSDQVNAITGNADGTLWFGTSHGVARRSSRAMTRAAMNLP